MAEIWKCLKCGTAVVKNDFSSVSPKCPKCGSSNDMMLEKISHRVPEIKKDGN